MIRPCLAAALAMATLLSPTAGRAQNTAIALIGGTTGVGPELSLTLTDQFGIRVSTKVLPLRFDHTFSDLDYSIETPRFVPAIVFDVLLEPDLGLRLDFGALFVPDGSTATAEPTGTVEIGPQLYEGSTIGTLTGELRHASLAPVVTVGIGRVIAEGIGFFADAGAVFLSEPDFHYRYFGPLRFNTEFNLNLELERQQVERQARDLRRVFPVLAAGIRVYSK